VNIDKSIYWIYTIYVFNNRIDGGVKVLKSWYLLGLLTFLVSGAIASVNPQAAAIWSGFVSILAISAGLGFSLGVTIVFAVAKGIANGFTLFFNPFARIDNRETDEKVRYINVVNILCLCALLCVHGYIIIAVALK